MSAETQSKGERRAPDEIFLTPRVVDRRAFEAFSSMLRESVERAGRESDLLARRAEAAASVLERLEGFVGAHSDIFQRAGALIDTIDQRQRSAGDTVETLTRRTELAQQAARDVESLARERGEAFEARLTTLAAATLDAFEASRQSLSGDASMMRRDLSQRLDELRLRGEALLASLTERAERAGEDVAGQVAQAEAAREALRAEQRETSRRLGEETDGLREGLRTESAALKRELDAAARALREAVAASAAHRDTIERAAELAVARVQAGAGEQALELERLTRRAEGLLREHRQSVESLGAEVWARLESALERAQAEAAGLEERTRARVELLGAEAEEHVSLGAEAAARMGALAGLLEEARGWTEAVESRGAVLTARLTEMVEAASAARERAQGERIAELRERLTRSESARVELLAKVESQDARLAGLEASLAALLARGVAADAASAELAEAPAPVVVSVRGPRKKAAPKVKSDGADAGVTESKATAKSPAKARARKSPAKKPASAGATGE